MNVVIIGATSALAHEAARCFAQEHAHLFLVARNEQKLKTVADDLRVRGNGKVETCVLDLTELTRHQEVWSTAVTELGRVDMLLIAHGTLGNQQLCEESVEETLKEFANNCISVISLLTISANYFEQQGQGCIAVISSVAGDRGRKSNYVYGTTKAAVSTFLQGLRNRLAKSGVKVLTIKPGYVATPMTAHLKKGLLMAEAAPVGKSIYEAMKQGKDIVYLPWFWRPIMLIVRSIPEGIFKRLSL